MSLGECGLKERFIYGTLATAVFITLLLFGSYIFAGGILIMAIIGYVEFVRIYGLKLTFVAPWLGVLGLISIVVPWNDYDLHFLNFETTLWLLLLLLMGLTVLTKNRIKLAELAPLFLGVVYIGFGFHYMIEVRALGLFWALLVFTTIWGSDIGAYLFGGWFGKRKLWPKISPNKTWEGAIGGVATSLVIAFVFVLIDSEQLSWSMAIQIGIVASVLGQIGDLIQSAYKRSAGVKDAGNLIPGHGGILDRCDSWIIVFPFIYYFILT